MCIRDRPGAIPCGAHGEGTCRQGEAGGGCPHADEAGHRSIPQVGALLLTNATVVMLFLFSGLLLFMLECGVLRICSADGSCTSVYYSSMVRSPLWHRRVVLPVQYYSKVHTVYSRRIGGK